MVKGLDVAIALAILVGACANGPPESDSPPLFAESSAAATDEGTETTNFTGPGLVCGFGFAIILDDGERLTRFDRHMDFLIYRLVSEERTAIIYEGNAPQEAEALIETSESFPSLVALHLKNGGYTNALAGRILVKDKLPSACKDQSES